MTDENHEAMEERESEKGDDSRTFWNNRVIASSDLQLKSIFPLSSLDLFLPLITFLAHFSSFFLSVHLFVFLSFFRFFSVLCCVLCAVLCMTMAQAVTTKRILQAIVSL